MMKRLVAALAAFGTMSGPAQAAEGDPLVFRPAGQWAADFGEDYCRLARTFSDGTNEISLAIERIQPGTLARLIIVGSGLRLYRRADTVGYRYEPGGESRIAFLVRSETGDGMDYLNFGDILIAPVPKTFAPPPLYDREAEKAFAGGIDALLLTNGFLEPVQVDTGSLKAPIEYLQACTDDLLVYWGLDLEKHQGLTRIALPDGPTNEWIPRGTIPFGDFGKMGGSMNQVRLMVDAAGKPTSCNVHWPSLAENTNKRICDALMKNAKFLPALDSAGQPFASYFTTAVGFLFGPPPGT